MDEAGRVPGAAAGRVMPTKNLCRKRFAPPLLFLLVFLVVSDGLALSVSAMTTSKHHAKKHHPKHAKKEVVDHAKTARHGKTHHRPDHKQTKAHSTSKHTHPPATLTAIQGSGQADDPPAARLQQEEEEDFGTTGAGDEQQSKPGPPPPPPSPQAAVAMPAGQNATMGGKSAAAMLWQEDVQYYGPCLRDYRALTLKENCPYFDDKAGGVTLFFSHCVDDEMTLLNMGYIAGQARKNIVQHGVGADVDKEAASSQVRHMLQKSKARAAFKCAPKDSDCARQSISQSDVPAALGQDRLCPAKCLEMEPLSGGDDAGMWAAMRARAKDVARGYRDVPEPAIAFEGGSAAWGAALAVCHHVSLVGKGGPHADGVIPDKAFTSVGMYAPPPMGEPMASLEEEGGQKHEVKFETKSGKGTCVKSKECVGNCGSKIFDDYITCRTWLHENLYYKKKPPSGATGDPDVQYCGQGREDCERGEATCLSSTGYKTMGSCGLPALSTQEKTGQDDMHVEDQSGEKTGQDEKQVEDQGEGGFQPALSTQDKTGQDGGGQKHKVKFETKSGKGTCVRSKECVGSVRCGSETFDDYTTCRTWQREYLYYKKKQSSGAIDDPDVQYCGQGRKDCEPDGEVTCLSSTGYETMESCAALSTQTGQDDMHVEDQSEEKKFIN